MELVIASVELEEGNVLTFKTFPTAPYSLGFVFAFHAAGEVRAELAYRVRKWVRVIYQSQPAPFYAHEAESRMMLTHADRVQLAFPSQGSYVLDILSGESLLYSLPFSVFDSSTRTDLEREILYYLKEKHGPRSVEEIARGVYNPKIITKQNFAEISGRVYFALLRMKEVINTSPNESGSLAEKMSASRWTLK